MGAARLHAIRGQNGHGLEVVLAGKSREAMSPKDYEAAVSAELSALAAALGCSLSWPLLWIPGPAEPGLVPNAFKGQTWGYQEDTMDSLLGWLRYLLLMR